MTQYPNPGDFLLRWAGDTLKVTLNLDYPRPGRAAFRCNLGNAKVRRAEIIAETERGEVPLAKAWTDIPMVQVSPTGYELEVKLWEVGIFSGKACFFAEGSTVPEWPDGANFHIKVEPAETKRNNSIYTVFPRQFGSFREIARRLPLIMDRMGFKIIQTLPPFPVPTSYAVMGEYGCPFAALDFLSVDSAMAEFDEYATPMDQFRELIDAVHARRGLFFVDLPANHTGWASTLQTHHPDWFHRESDGKFVSPGAWGVKWADLVELDYSKPELRAYMADVFLFWCRNGVDGFRCDAGYMIPLKTWEYIVSRVREEYPDTVFMLEGLGGELSVTDALLKEANLDWAYSEIFQTYDRGQFEWYLPSAIARSEKYGTLVHFAETHDNDRLAKGGKAYARLRVQLAALLSWQGAWGIANGVEWYCKEKIDVHGKNDLNWGAVDNMVPLIAKLNRILNTHPAFIGTSHLELVTRGEGNTLAVSRGGVLILANLDCTAPARIQWRQDAFKCSEAFDILAEEPVDCSSGGVALKPGEVKCLMPFALAQEEVPQDAELVDARRTSQAPRFHWVFPRDVNRDVAVPEEELVEISAPYHFRMRIIDPETGRTIRVQRSVNNRVVFDAPHYHGNGLQCRELSISMVVYTPGKSTRTISRFFIPPPGNKAKVRLALDGAEIRRHPEYRTVLSNGAGAAAQVRLGWGEIRSQYDAILAANPNPTVPSDRVNLWARTRCWLQREGYTREFDKHCQTKFTADPAGKAARWDFTVPCGMGKETSFSFELALAPDENAARLKVVRKDAGHLDVGDQVRIVFRPDIEWRSFHATTKAYAGLETLFPQRTVHMDDGFAFRPYDGIFRMSVKNGAYHHEPQWSYNVPHSEEAARGQEGGGDLYSPGWISADLKVGEEMEIIGIMNPMNLPELINFPDLREEGDAGSIGQTMKKALELYIVRRDELKTVIAGYPWFLDWGRDTFIFMRGMIAAGMIDDSLKILKAFAAFEEEGTLPNIIYGNTAGNRDTADAQLWFVECVSELDKLGVDVSELKATCENIVKHYKDGTPNGIRMDADSGLVWCPSHFTWMDTNYPACTPRMGYPVEIQALWISALRFLGQHELAKKALRSVEKYFKRDVGYEDCLAAPNGEPARSARGEGTIRPNQLFLITLGLVKDASILAATEELLIPGGIRSLNAGHELYRGRYEGDEDTCRKPAYHNGTVWAWPFPLYAEAMAELDPRHRRAALAVLAGAVANLNAGCVAHMSENADGDAPHAQKGCTAQAWSDSELLRVWLKLGGR